MKLVQLNIKEEYLIKFKDRLLETIKEINSNTKGYEKINTLLNELNDEISINKKEIKDILNDDSKYINFKAKKATILKLFEIKNAYQLNNIDDTLDLVLDDVIEMFFIYSLDEIVDVVQKKEIESYLNGTEFYVGKKKDDESHILIAYKIDDLVIYEELKYLDLKVFERYIINNVVFLFSPKFTLKDINNIKSSYTNL